MPTPSLPPRTTSVRNAIFEAPDESGLSISVPTTYSLFTSDISPSSSVGTNGDWYFYSANGAIKTYRKISGVWSLTSTISSGGGGGGGGGDITALDDVDISNSSITTSSIAGGTIVGAAISSGTITGTTISSSTLTSPTITNPTVTTGTLTNSSIVTPTLTGGTITGSAISGGTITGLPSPSGTSDAATKGYVDGVGAGLDYHENVVVATSANITLTGGAPSSIDGISLLVNDRILVRSQTDQKTNGIYYVTTVGTGSNGTWARALDADTGAELDTGTYVLVLRGTNYAGTGWVMNAPGPITLGTTNITWVQSAAGLTIPDGAITAAKLANGALEYTKFAAGLTPVEIVASMPTTDNKQGRMVFLTATDGSFAANKLYRWTSPTVTTGTAFWTAAVPAVDITGNLTSDQIASLDAAKLTGTITATTVADGSITTPKIAAGAISSAKIAAGAIIAGSIASGAVTAGTIAAGAVTSGTIAANAVTSGTIQAGAIGATQIATDAIRANHILAGEIVATKLATDSVTTGAISAGAVTAAKITVSNLAAIKADLGTITAGSLTASSAINVGSGFNQVQISDGVLSSAGGKINLIGDGVNPRIRVYGFGSYASHYAEINSQSSGIGAPYFGTSGPTSLVSINGSAGIVVTGGAITVGASTVIKGTGGGQINLLGGGSDALDIVCGEVPTSGGSPAGYLALKVNGRTVWVAFED